MTGPALEIGAVGRPDFDGSLPSSGSEWSAQECLEIPLQNRAHRLAAPAEITGRTTCEGRAAS